MYKFMHEEIKTMFKSITRCTKHYKHSGLKFVKKSEIFFSSKAKIQRFLKLFLNFLFFAHCGTWICRLVSRPRVSPVVKSAIVK